jgi:4-hydroxybenzoate polyprenyltransferase
MGSDHVVTTASVSTGSVGRSKRRRLPALILETMRPPQWSKNLFVLGGLVFSGRALEVETATKSAGTFVAFCALSGAAYLVNDAADAEKDRSNPRTARRPIARGDLKPSTAVRAAVLIAAAAVGVAAFINWQTVTVLGGFLVLQVAYSLVLRRVFLVDVMAIALGFVLRALAGLVAIEALLSPWLLLATGLLALFLGLTKRRSEVVVRGGTTASQRSVLVDYTVELVDQLIAVVTPTVLVVYAIYSVLGAQSELMPLTLPFVLYGIFRVLYLIRTRSTMTEDPSAIMWRDRPLLVCIAIWGAFAAGLTLTAA